VAGYSQSRSLNTDERFDFTMPTNKHSLILLTREPAPALIQEALDRLMTTDLAEFASHLELSRSMWRKFPELVEAPGFPEHLRAALVEERGDEPDDDANVSEEAIEPGHRESLRAAAVQIARGWMQRGRERIAS
jgi:hypothetical protein